MLLMYKYEGIQHRQTCTCLTKNISIFFIYNKWRKIKWSELKSTFGQNKNEIWSEFYQHLGQNKIINGQNKNNRRSE